MHESQDEIDLHYYSRWEIEAAREQIAQDTAVYACLIAGLYADLKWDWWAWDILAGVVVFMVCTFGRSKRTKEAWLKYENRPFLQDHDN